MGSKAADRIVSECTLYRSETRSSHPTHFYNNRVSEIRVQSGENKNVTHELLHINKLYLMKKASQFFLHTQEVQFFSE